MLTAKEAADLAEYRRAAYQHDMAHKLAAENAARAVREIQEHLEQQNYGLAKDAIRELLENGLPNDHGGPVTHYPMFERALELVK